MSHPTEACDRSEDVSRQLSMLGQCRMSKLQQAWQRSKRAAPPLGLSRDLLIRALAYDIQEQAFGTMPKVTLRRLKTLAVTNTGTDHSVFAAPTLKPGTRLVRDWGGATHTVLVLEVGFDYGGRRYASLSKIAEVISGHHRSGPAFFGLKRRDPRFILRPSADGGAQ
jgi:hypothetical protein